MPNRYLPSALLSVIDDVYDSSYDLEELDANEYPSEADVLIDEMLKPEYRDEVRSKKGGSQ